MDTEKLDESYVTIHFDSGDNVKLKKSFLTNQSLYFEAMFCGNFIESLSGDKIQLKDANYAHFMSIINSLKHDTIIFNTVEELFLILETSLYFQFTDTIKKSIQIINENILKLHAIPVLMLASRLSLPELYEKARIYILYNFKAILSHSRTKFFELNKADLLLLLNDNGLNVDNEVDVFNLVIDWCSQTKNYDMECEMVAECVHFSSMDANQLQYSISKSKNLNLQNIIKQYNIYDIQTNSSLKHLIRPARCIPNALCAVKNDPDGDIFIWKWDWQSLKFSRFLQLDPLPRHTVGYHVLVKDMDIYVMGGEIGYFRGKWNECGWKYSLISKEWTKLENFVPSKRRNGIAHFCGDDLFLIGGRTKHRLRNKLMEHFRIDKDKNTLVQIADNECFTWGKNIMSVKYLCLEYKGQFIMIKKFFSTKWHSFCFDKSNPLNYKWDVNLMNIEPVIICATVYLETVYLLASHKNIIALHSYCPKQHTSQIVTCFNISYEDRMMCAFNGNKAMIFNGNVLSYFLIDENIHRECYVNRDSFYVDNFFNVPIY